MTRKQYLRQYTLVELRAYQDFCLMKIEYYSKKSHEISEKYRELEADIRTVMEEKVNALLDYK